MGWQDLSRDAKLGKKNVLRVRDDELMSEWDEWTEENNKDKRWDEGRRDQTWWNWNNGNAEVFCGKLKHRELKKQKYQQT